METRSIRRRRGVFFLEAHARVQQPTEPDPTRPDPTDLAGDEACALAREEAAELRDLLDLGEIDNSYFSE